MPGCKYRLYNVDGDRVGVYEELAWNWQQGETFQVGDGRRFRIVGIVELDHSDDSGAAFQAAFVVEPAHEVPRL